MHLFHIFSSFLSMACLRHSLLNLCLSIFIIFKMPFSNICCYHIEIKISLPSCFCTLGFHLITLLLTVEKNIPLKFFNIKYDIKCKCACMRVHYRVAEDGGLLHCFLSFIFCTPTEMSTHMFLPSLFYYAELHWLFFFPFVVFPEILIYVQ